ncbi:MAG: hypothetical protein K2G44_02405 [Clostridia bacterium]|nr:hypothetical protein [Clostridia bacterium]
MNIEKLIKNEANEKTPELFSEILDKAGAEGLIPQSEVAQYNAPKKSKTPKKGAGNVGFVLATIAAVTSLAAGLGIGLPLWIGGEGAPSDPGYGAEAPAPETPVTPVRRSHPVRPTSTFSANGRF